MPAVRRGGVAAFTALALALSAPSGISAAAADEAHRLQVVFEILESVPFIDGHKLLQVVKEKGINVPAIFVSGLPGEEPELRAFEIGAADFIRKPVKNNVLLARVARALGA